MLRPLALIAASAILLSGCSLLAAASVEEMTLAVGECVSNPDVAENTEGEVDSLPRVDCEEPHDAEVFHILEIDELTDAALDAADQECYDAYEGYMGVPYEDGTYYYTTLSPTEDSWDAGDRQVACLVVGEVGEELTGSLKGAEA